MTRQGKAALYGLIGRVLAGETELQGSLVMETLTQDFNLVRQLDEMIDVHDRQLREQAQHDVNIKRLQQIPGIGPVTASALETVKLLLFGKKNSAESDRDGEFETAGLQTFAKWIENCWKTDRN